eukprot:7738734-Alexandrium_andersonii.AAC.1
MGGRGSDGAAGLELGSPLLLAGARSARDLRSWNPARSDLCAAGAPSGKARAVARGPARVGLD